MVLTTKSSHGIIRASVSLSRNYLHRPLQGKHFLSPEAYHQAYHRLHDQLRWTPRLRRLMHLCRASAKDPLPVLLSKNWTSMISEYAHPIGELSQTVHCWIAFEMTSLAYNAPNVTANIPRKSLTRRIALRRPLNASIHLYNPMAKQRRLFYIARMAPSIVFDVVKLSRRIKT